MKSVSESQDSGSPLDIIRPPYVEVTVVAITHLELLDIGQVEPYLHISLGTGVYETPVLVPDEEILLSFELEMSEDPLVIRLIDRDHYSKGERLMAVVIPDYEFPSYQGRPTDLFLRIPPDYSDDLLPLLSPSLLLPSDTTSPCLHLRITAWDEVTLSRITVHFTESSIRSTAMETYTLYNVHVNRADGGHWTVQLRYSELCRLREDISRDYPELRRLSFPGKTYMECLAVLCPALSRFSVNRIEDRRKALETFTNNALQVSHQTYSPLLHLLNIYTNT